MDSDENIEYIPPKKKVKKVKEPKVENLSHAQKEQLVDSIKNEMEAKHVVKAKKKAAGISKFNRGKAVKTQKKAVSYLQFLFFCF